ncbi:fork head domain-containing protein [Ephemerocybe angulata]|uniref:Fork head domain-containing protein n=1 Tax=Ephemerocybe angulata TaxID=980116 RepID=A0A8H6M6P5_9AGAR|nr:fork head domain-containing protein [Tulosesus angulatus]
MGHPSDFHSLQLPTLNPHLTSCASPSYRRSFHPSCNNPVPCAFIDDGLPHHSGCPRLNTYHSYPPSDIDTSAGIERISFSGEQIEENLGNQALSAPGDFLRQKLGLKPGEPVNLWSLPDPEPDKRPPHSYPLLVRLAIYGSPNQRMTLKQIYEAIEERFEFYRKQPKGAWRGSIRHNLSLNQVFKNVHHDRPLTEPGNYGEIDHSVGEEYKCERKDDQSWNRNPVRRLERL